MGLKSLSDAPAKARQMLINIANHIGTANASHAKALGGLTDLQRYLDTWYASGSVNAPNPVGNPEKDDISCEGAALMKDFDALLRRL